MTVKTARPISWQQALYALAETTPRIAGPNDAVVQAVQAEIARARAEMEAQLLARQQPFAYLRQHAQLIDQVIAALWQVVQIRHAPIADSERCYCIATGGYARRELYPYSDIDIVFLHHAAKASIRTISEAVLSYLWDLGFQVGHATRTAAECVELALADHTIATALVDQRYVCGNHERYQQFVQFWSQRRHRIFTSLWVRAKLEECDLRHHKQGDSRFLVEPNIKENKGGLRDLHLLHWLARAIYEVDMVGDLVQLGKLDAKEYRDFQRAHHFLALVRIHLHRLTGRADERLSFDRQLQLSEMFGFRNQQDHPSVERFMKRYFQMVRMVGNLTHLFCTMLEEEQQNLGFFRLSRWLQTHTLHGDFVMRGNRLDFKDAGAVESNPILLLKLFYLAQEEQLEIHPKAWQTVTRHLGLISRHLRLDPQANQLFLQMLTSQHQPDITLTRLNESGVLSKLIPDFAHIVCQMQYDMYHVYTVDEHTIRLIGVLHAVETGLLIDELPLASHVIHQIHSRSALLVAAFCHDIAKGRGGNHAQLGVQITTKLGRRFGLDEADIRTAAWLVEHHLLFSNTAFSRDLDDPQTLVDFVAIVQSPERLRLLLLITVADIRAVGPKIWNGWKGSLLRELYARAEAEMGTPLAETQDELIAAAKARLAPVLAEWSAEWSARYLDAATSHFWLGLPEEQHPAVARLLKQFWHQPEPHIALNYDIHHFEAITHIRLCTPDHPELMRVVAGTIAMIGGTIVGCKSFTLHDDTAIMLLDIQDNQSQAFEDKARLEHLAQIIQSVLNGEVNIADEINRRRKRFTARHKSLELAPSIFIDNGCSAQHTVVEINAADRIGLLYDIAATMTGLNLNIVTSHITTYGAKAVDVFYIKDQFGLKVEHPALIATLQRELVTRLSNQAA